ncbi:GroES-like protein [Hortaea werneckii]|uniref:Alcohol dehydrogenase-like N-terminal domain-containing protein n=1 Tax=Hortaea werneckii TaxID=91943 RepID=A0A3M7DYE0_HORWE|nr:GroES-like protein [Hortaea werneckii]KAI6859293.1 GroES-like protein [Hortaea werneckii]KAI7206045.1 GroES-like protein [Hortaea werneckii]KAI7356309.1 GroES-like protein [Hortaea werneckii]KAI7560127.1 GroES-like protein [Hortaea werneckii]
MTSSPSDTHVSFHAGSATIAQDVSNPAKDRKSHGHPTETMRALVWNAKNNVQLIETAKPVLFDNNKRDAIVRVTGTTICGSDLHLLHGAIVQCESGDILGHEFCGVVEEIGENAENNPRGFKVGDRVVASFQIACGDCYYCKQKLSSQCERTNSNETARGMYGEQTAGMFGYSHFTGGFAGGQAEYVRVPNADVNLLPLPEDVPDEKGLFLSDVLATSYHCVVDTGIKKGDIVGIWGAGPIGLMCADYSFMEGASRVIMIDNNWRLDYVKSKVPKVESLDFSIYEDVPAKLREMTKENGVNGGLNVALECVAGEYPKTSAQKKKLAAGIATDTSDIVNEMIKSVKSFGRCGVTGVYVGSCDDFNIGSIMERGIRFFGNGQAPVHMYWEDLLKKIQSGEIDPLKMVSHRCKLEDVETVYKKFEAREDGLQKIFIQTRFSDPPAVGTPQLTVY